MGTGTPISRSPKRSKRTSLLKLRRELRRTLDSQRTLHMCSPTVKTKEKRMKMMSKASMSLLPNSPQLRKHMPSEMSEALQTQIDSLNLDRNRVLSDREAFQAISVT